MVQPQTRKPHGVLYRRKSEVEPGNSLNQQLAWGQKRASELGLELNVPPEVATGASKRHEVGDVYSDAGVSGFFMHRLGFDAMMKRITGDPAVTHILVYKRDRFARPEDAATALAEENKLRQMGKTLIFGDEVLPPLKGTRADIGQQISGIVSFHESGVYLDNLAERVIPALVELAKKGYWTGGRPPYGFARVLVDQNDKVIRELQDGERVRQPGCHVRLLPKDQEKIKVCMQMFEWRRQRWGFKRIAKQLNASGIPSPDAGRSRSDKYGNSHRVSGKWSQNTVSSLLRNSAFIGELAFGSRSEGIRRRVSSSGVRQLGPGDFSGSGQPRVIRNAPADQIRAGTGYEAVVDKELFRDVQNLNEKCGKSQRGTTRARDPYVYPLAGRIHDASPGCGWPMYGLPRGKHREYLCGRYHVTAGDCCEHNAVDANLAMMQVLRSIRLNVLRHDLRPRLRQELMKISHARKSHSGDAGRISQLQAELAVLQDGLRMGCRNMLVARTDEIRAAMELEFEAMSTEVKAKAAELKQLQEQIPTQLSPEVEVAKAMALVDDVERLANVGHGPELRRLLETLDVNVWLRFEKVQKGKRLLNKVAGGIITTGEAAHPIQKYNGPRNGSAASNHTTGMKDFESGEPWGPPDSKSLQKVYRGERI